MSTTPWLTPPIDWTVPAGPTDWLHGTGATRLERVVVGACAAAGTAAVAGVALHAGVDWRWWQWLLVLLVAVDLLGGAPANALSTAKRLYHSTPPAGTHLLGRLVRHPLGFSALHLHPFVLLALLPGGTWAWGLACYLGCLAGTAFVLAAPAYVRRAVAFAVVALLLVLAPLVAPPDGLQWFGPLLAVKLVLAHTVREEPYRPGPWTTTAQTPPSANGRGTGPARSTGRRAAGGPPGMVSDLRVDRSGIGPWEAIEEATPVVSGATQLDQGDLR